MIKQLRDWLAIATLTTWVTGDVLGAEHVARWIRNTDGQWFDVANWDIGAWPDNTGSEVFDVVWDAHPVNVELNRAVPVTIRNFTFSSGGTLTGAVNLIITGDLNWTAGEMRGPDSVVRSTIVNGQSTLNAAPGQYIALVNRNLLAGSLTQLQSTLWIQTIPGAEFISRIDVNGAGELDIEAGASIKVLPPGKGGTVNNFGLLRILSSPVPFDSEVSLFNRRIVEIGDRTVNFAPGTGINLEGLATKLVLNGGRIPRTPPDASGTNGGTVTAITSGEIAGQGEIGVAYLGFDPVTVISESFLSGHITFGELHLKPTATYTVTITGGNAGQFDHLIVQNKLRLNGALKIQIAEGVEDTILDTDVFEILTPGPGCDALGEFVNVPIGQRIETIDGKGTFLVDRAAPGSSSIVLRDFKGIPFHLQDVGGTVIYPPHPQSSTGLDAAGPVPIAAEASLTARPSLNWTGANLVSEVTAGFDPVHDLLAVQSPAFSLTGDRVYFDGPSGSVDIGGWTSSGSQLRFVFNADATVDSVQALIRSVAFFNNAYYLEAFVTGAERFPQRTVRLTLTDGTGYELAQEALIQFPFVTGIRFEYPRMFISYNTVATRNLLSEFSDGVSRRLPKLGVAMTPCGVTPRQNIEACPSAVDSSQIIVHAGGGSEVYPADAHVGPFHARLCVKFFFLSETELSPGSGCIFHWLTVVTYDSSYEDCFGAPALSAAALLAQEPPPPRFSLAPLYALQSLMKQTVEGRRLVNLYWQHTAEVVSILIAHPELIDQATDLVASFETAVHAFLSGTGTSAQITPTMISALNAFWDALASHASSALQTALLTERNRFNGFQDFAGKDFSQWAGLLQIQNPSEPWIYISNIQVAESQVQVEANQISGRSLSLWRSADLTHWELTPGAQIQTEGFTMRLIDPTPTAPKSFYQVRAQ